MSMDLKSLDDLRAMARALGLRGYSKLRKNELVKLLKQHTANTHTRLAAPAAAGRAARQPMPTPDAKTAATPRRSARRAVSASASRAGEPTASAEPAAQLLSQPAQVSSEEERIETAKFAVTPAGTALSPRALADALHENIEQLPALAVSTLCLLPQKPGVLYAYWVLAPTPPAPLAALRLRLCRRPSEGPIEILEEVSLLSTATGWYFHIPENAEPGAYLVHLGHYTADGEFVTAIERGVARIPSLYASSQTDRRWWISETDFRALYQRSGGLVRGARLGWPGGVSSQR
jgi:hypothetical protein